MSEAADERILVACVGNIFLGDDGFGFVAAEALAACAPRAGVEVRDYGIRGLDLAYDLLKPWKAVVLVDAIRRGGEPGTLYLLRLEEEAAKAGAELDPHAIDPARVLALARSMGEVSAAMYILGCEPQSLGDDLEGQMGLSPPVAAAVPEAVRMVLDLTERLQAARECAAATGGER